MFGLARLVVRFFERKHHDYLERTDDEFKERAKQFEKIKRSGAAKAQENDPHSIWNLRITPPKRSCFAESGTGGCVSKISPALEQAAIDREAWVSSHLHRDVMSSISWGGDERTVESHEKFVRGLPVHDPEELQKGEEQESAAVEVKRKAGGTCMAGGVETCVARGIVAKGLRRTEKRIMNSEAAAIPKTKKEADEENEEQKKKKEDAREHAKTIKNNVESAMRLQLYKWRTLIQHPRDPDGMHNMREPDYRQIAGQIADRHAQQQTEHMNALAGPGLELARKLSQKTNQATRRETTGSVKMWQLLYGPLASGQLIYRSHTAEAVEAEREAEAASQGHCRKSAPKASQTGNDQGATFTANSGTGAGPKDESVVDHSTHAHGADALAMTTTGHGSREAAGKTLQLFHPLSGYARIRDEDDTD